MKNTSRSINLHGGVEKLDPNISIPETWMEHSNRNIQESQSNIFCFMVSEQSLLKDFDILTQPFSSLFLSLTFYIIIGSKITLKNQQLFSSLIQSRSVRKYQKNGHLN